MTHSIKQTEVPIIFNSDMKISHFVVCSISRRDFPSWDKSVYLHSGFSFCTQTVVISRAHSLARLFLSTSHNIYKKISQPLNCWC